MSESDYSQRYVYACIGAVTAYTEKITRFGAGTLRVESGDATLRRFYVDVRHSLDVRWEFEVQHGTVRANADDHVQRNLRDHEQAVSAACQHETARGPTTITELVRSLESQQYPGFAERSCIRDHPRTLFYQYSCNRCSGRGRVTCTSCGGQGKVNCFSCSGSGKTNCYSCHGRGMRSEYHTELLPGGGTRGVNREVRCSLCSNGKVTCTGCYSNGKTTCASCGGNGDTYCGGCGGKGALTRVTRVRVYSTPTFVLGDMAGTPNYVALALQRHGLANIGLLAQVHYSRANVQAAAATASMYYDTAVWFCQLLLTTAGRTAKCILFGAQPMVADAGGFLEAILDSDLASLETVPKSRFSLGMGSRRSARAALKNFMASEIHRQIVEGNATGYEPEAIAHHLREVVSAHYVRRALSALVDTLKATLAWRQITWIVALALLSVLGVPLTFAASGTPIGAQLADRDMIAVPMALAPRLSVFSVPIVLAGSIVASLASTWWLARVGGKHLRVLAKRRKLRHGFLTALAALVGGALCTTAVYTAFPFRVDPQGRAYGLVPVMEPSRSIVSRSPIMRAAPALAATATSARSTAGAIRRATPPAVTAKRASIAGPPATRPAPTQPTAQLGKPAPIAVVKAATP